MQHSLRPLSYRPTALAAFAVTLRALYAGTASAQVFDGPGLVGGVELAEEIEGIADINNPRATVVRIVTAILEFAALLAVIMVIIAGFYLILSLGEDEKKDKAKKIILYTLIGLVVLLFARIIVGLVTHFLAGQL
jgi:hypothetical protein